MNKRYYSKTGLSRDARFIGLCTRSIYFKERKLANWKWLASEGRLRIGLPGNVEEVRGINQPIENELLPRNCQGFSACRSRGSVDGEKPWNDAHPDLWLKEEKGNSNF